MTELADNAPPSDADLLVQLADAISDVGYWSWWTHELPELFQLEFGGTQLYFPPASADLPPRTQIALQFQQPASVSFLSRGEGTADFAWAQALHDDQLEPPTCSYGEFGFGNGESLTAMLQQATHRQTMVGYEPTAEAFLQEPYQLVFWCGNFGFAIAAQGLRLVTHSGAVVLDQVPEVNREWWAYWRRYWDNKDTPEALPKDFACEVTIPLKS